MFSSLAVRISMPLVGLLAAAAIAASLALGSMLSSLAQDDGRRRAEVYPALLESALAEMLWNMDVGGAGRALDSLAQDADFLAAVVRDDKGKELTRRGKVPGDGVGDAVKASRPILREGKPVGELTVWLSTRRAEEQAAARSKPPCSVARAGWR